MSIFRPKIDITHQYVYSFDMSSTTFDPTRPFNELPPLPPAQVVETVPVLKAIIAAKEKLKAQYYRCLNRVTTESAWEDWLLFMIRGVEVAATDAATMIADLRQVQDEITAVIRDADIISPAKEMSEITMVRPYLRIQDVEDSGLVKRQTAATWLNHLVDIGVLSETKRGRQRIFINDAALRVLTRE